jgi:hypothetical protein
MAREWNRVALAVARKTGQTVGLNASTRITMDAKPVAQFPIQFFDVPTDRAPTILGEVDLLALDAVTAIRQAPHAAWPPRAIGFCLIDREGRAVFGRRKADRLWASCMILVHRCAVTSGAGRLCGGALVRVPPLWDRRVELYEAVEERRR